MLPSLQVDCGHKGVLRNLDLGYRLRSTNAWNIIISPWCLLELNYIVCMYILVQKATFQKDQSYLFQPASISEN